MPQAHVASETSSFQASRGTHSERGHHLVPEREV
jgi:hypothetical protein